MFECLIKMNVDTEKSISLQVNNVVYTVHATMPPETTLNEYIRNYVLAKGTKYMCQEGGCGACIVAVKKFNSTIQKTEIFAVNSCLVPVFVCYGWSIITIEGIGNKTNGFHKIQSTLAGFSGTQCGYCSPGMVMNMFSLLNGRDKLTMKEVENFFGGNICRCTGYRPILDAFKSLSCDATDELKKLCMDIEDMMKESKVCPKTNNACIGSCGNSNSDEKRKRGSFALVLPAEPLALPFASERQWVRVKELSDIYKLFETMKSDTKYMLVAGYTSHGVYRVVPQDYYIDVTGVDELHKYSYDLNKLTIGANVSLTDTMNILGSVAKQNPRSFGYLNKLVDHLDLVANVSVRNIGTLAGNLSIKYAHREFPSDVFLMLETAGAVLTVGHVSGTVDEYTLPSYLMLDMNKRVIINIHLPARDNSFIFSSFKIMKRTQNTPADVNAGFLFKIDTNNKRKVWQKPSIVYGGINSNFIHAQKTEEFLNRKEILDVQTIKNACVILKNELNPSESLVDGSPKYRRSLAVNLLYKFILSIAPDRLNARFRSGGTLLKRPLSSGKQDFQLDKSMYPVGRPIVKLEAFLQCSGEVEYVNDIPTLQGELYATFVLSKSGPAKIESIDTSAIKNLPGVVKFLSVKDIPGRNTFVEGGKVEEEPLFADKNIQYYGQPVGIVIATSQSLANTASDLIVVNVIDKRKPVIGLKNVIESNDTSRIYERAAKKATDSKNDIKYKLKGSFLTGPQYHYTMETQSCFCVPTDDGIDVYPASQWPTAIQLNVSAVLNIPMNNVNVSVKRCGGGFGSKLGRSALIAAACAVAANDCKKPVRMVMKMETNMEAIGKRFPCYAEYEVAVNEKGVIQNLNLNWYSENGAFTNEDAAASIIFFCGQLYDTTTWNLRAFDVRTDILPNTYARSPGSCEGIATVEYIMEHIAHVTNQDYVTVRMANLSPLNSSIIPSMFNELKKNSDFHNRREMVEKFNQENRWKKRGLAISFMDYPHTNIFKYHVIVSIFASDGTVSVAHGGIEIGQGINTKVAQACAYKLAIDVSMIKIKPTTTLISPNDGETGGSMASDSVTWAALDCCDILLQRLAPIKVKNPNISWKDLINAANTENVDLCAETMFNPTVASSSYDIRGMVVTEVEIDVLTGQHVVLRVDLSEDVGKSISPYVDIGQVEGAFIMGLGYWMNEKLVYDQNTGQLLTNRSWNYTPPTAKDIPVDFRIYFQRNSSNPLGVLRSKAVGEPPLCLAISAVFATRHAIAAARKDTGVKDEWFEIDLPYVPENILSSTLTSIQQFDL